MPARVSFGRPMADGWEPQCFGLMGQCCILQAQKRNPATAETSQWRLTRAWNGAATDTSAGYPDLWPHAAPSCAGRPSRTRFPCVNDAAHIRLEPSVYPARLVVE